MAELMPISRPPESSSGPPELPGLIAASVWIMCSRAPLPSSWGSARSRAETMPVVSDQSRPNGLPMANTFCPTLRSALLPIGTSADLKVGQKVFAIGNPFGLDWSLTTGIVSALDRALPDEDGKGALEHMIQTDAAINPGNSGGPLLDSGGRLIGINSAIFSPSGAYAGIGFAVPVDTV